MACAEQKLKEFGPIAWKTGVCGCAVLAAGGYPGDYAKGDEIQGLEQAEQHGAIVFQAGTSAKDGKIYTDGGRVLAVSALAPTYDAAFAQIDAAIAAIHFANAYYRRDIGHRVRSNPYSPNPTGQT
jgi:phosphoribosylamine--glycine ligase